MSSKFPTIQEILAVHEDQIEQFGGSHGLRDIGALESALLRPQMGYYDGIIEEAAALLESLAMNHPFIDGNKRVAFFITAAFLMQNAHFIDCDNDETHRFFMRLFETNSFRFAELREWLEEHVKPLPAT